ncbi:cytochrome c oxidase subunit 4, mitochondrial [Monosporozyma unispora]
MQARLSMSLLKTTAPRMMTLRTAVPVSRRLFCSRSLLQNKQQAHSSTPETTTGTAHNLAEVNGPESLIGPGAKEGTIPTDLEQATGLERLELLGKLEGIDVFDTKPLDASRRGTMKDPIVVDSYDDYRYVGCTGSPAGSHQVMWLKPTVDQVARCWECGSVYKINPVGVPDPHHKH